MSEKWYQNWFNSPYYHILYHQRNDDEAEFFIDNLLNHLKTSSDAKLLDIACGRGRHSIYLNKKGFDVTGIDLSYANIKYARQFENENLHFFVHDMRYLFYINYFDVCFNLFTSFGYFDTEKDHINSLKVFRKSLTKDGLLVLDFFNSEKIVRNLKKEEVKHIDGIDFYITKTIDEGKIIKSITFNHRQQHFSFQEEVKALSMKDFERMFELSGFEIRGYFGDYSLNEFDPEKSDRLIFICSKSHA
jgi:SAM-dependent methyltransferase